MVVVNRGEIPVHLCRGEQCRILCREHGEIQEQNIMVVGRFMGPSCVG